MLNLHQIILILVSIQYVQGQMERSGKFHSFIADLIEFRETLYEQKIAAEKIDELEGELQMQKTETEQLKNELETERNKTKGMVYGLSMHCNR